MLLAIRRWAYDNFLQVRTLKQAENVRQQLERLMTKHGLPLVSTNFESSDYYENIRKAVTSGFFM